MILISHSFDSITAWLAALPCWLRQSTHVHKVPGSIPVAAYLMDVTTLRLAMSDLNVVKWLPTAEDSQTKDYGFECRHRILDIYSTNLHLNRLQRLVVGRKSKFETSSI